MNPARNRFYTPSLSLDLQGLLGRVEQGLAVFCGCAVAVHLSLTQVRGWSQRQKAVQLLTTQFIKRAPRLTKPLEMKKRPRPEQRPLRRETMATKAKVSRRESAGSPRW